MIIMLLVVNVVLYGVLIGFFCGGVKDTPFKQAGQGKRLPGVERLSVVMYYR